MAAGAESLHWFKSVTTSGPMPRTLGSGDSYWPERGADCGGVVGCLEGACFWKVTPCSNSVALWWQPVCDLGMTVRHAGLVHQVRLVRLGLGDPAVMLAQFRLSAVLVPLWGDEVVWTADEDGLRWILTFSTEDELAAFVHSKDLALDGFPYMTVLGSRLLDVAVPALGVPAGVVLDLFGTDPMVFPPVRGIVPDEVALDGLVSGGGVRVG